MKKLTVLIGFLLLTSCGEDANKTQEVATQMNIFNAQALGSDQIEAPFSLLGLWQSDVYQHNGVSMQIRWQIQSNKTTLTKKCTTEKGIVYFAQISAPVNTNIIQQNNITTSTVTMSQTSAQTDIVEMTDGKVCRVSLDPQNGNNQSIIEGDGEEILMSGNTIKNGQIELLYVSETRIGNLTKIGN